MIKSWKTLLSSLLTAVVFTASVCLPSEGAAVQSEIKPSDLYAQSAVLMDADSGRILFSKSGQKERPMASTTKIMTCILVLEKGGLSDEVSVSKNAASQPKVKLGMKEGEKYILKDLLYSLMLESHNDTAVAVAEHAGGSTQRFAEMMNAKAAELGCTRTYFITPNGLDAQDDGGIHHTTAEELARIMKYCIMESPAKNEFLDITRTASWSFTDTAGKRSFQCTNHNIFLNMMEGALTGKTGFTADAGYCYVGALRQGERTFIVALLACGWPNAKSYKWADTRKLMNYGLDNYYVKSAASDIGEKEILVKNAAGDGFPDKKSHFLTLSSSGRAPAALVRDGEEIEVKWDIPEKIYAPVKQGEVIGNICYTLEGIILAEYPVTARQDVQERNFKVCAVWLRDHFFLGGI